MNYVLPKLFRSKYGKDACLDLEPVSITYNAGFYIQRGSLKGIIDHESQLYEIFFPEKTMILDEGYRLYPSYDMIYWDSKYQTTMATKGWKLISLEENTISICCMYLPDHDDDIVTILKNNHVYTKVDRTNSISLYSVNLVDEQTSLFFPQDNFLCVVKGRISINNDLKRQRTWIRSTKDQTLNIVNENHEQSIVFLFKPR